MKRTLLASVFAACAAASLAPATEPAPAFRDFGEDGKIVVGVAAIGIALGNAKINHHDIAAIGIAGILQGIRGE